MQEGRYCYFINRGKKRKQSVCPWAEGLVEEDTHNHILQQYAIIKEGISVNGIVVNMVLLSRKAAECE